jgi:hypothetical protein
LEEEFLQLFGFERIEFDDLNGDDFVCKILMRGRYL